MQPAHEQPLILLVVLPGLASTAGSLQGRTDGRAVAIHVRRPSTVEEALELLHGEESEFEPRGSCSDSMEHDLRSALFVCGGDEERSRRSLVALPFVLGNLRQKRCRRTNEIGDGRRNRSIAQRKRRAAACLLQVEVGELCKPRCDRTDFVSGRSDAANIINQEQRPTRRNHENTMDISSEDTQQTTEKSVACRHTSDAYARCCWR